MILKYFFIAVFITNTLFLASALAADAKVPVVLQAKLFLTALTYKKSLEKDEDKQLKIGLLYFPKVPQSKKEVLQFSQVLDAFKGKKVRNLSIVKVLLVYRGNDDLKKKISLENIDVLYIASGKKEFIKKVTQVTQSEKVLSLSGIAEYVTECGVSMAIGIQANKPKIYLNRFSASAEGADFSAKFLRVVKIVGENKG